MFSKNFSSRSLFQSCFVLLFAAALGGITTLGSEPAAAVEMRDLVGEWAIPDTNEKLMIRRSGEWYHPKYGRAKIRPGNDAADISVFYEGIETKCSYRVSVADGGNTLIFAAADTRQDGDRCPTGRFKSVDH
jgi:hypothetical protein